MDVKDLLPGSKVEIHMIQMMNRKKESNDNQGSYLSVIYDVNSDDSIDINMPTELGKLQILPKNIHYEFEFTMRQGIYKADGRVVEHLKKGHVYLVRVRLSSPLKKFQRREYFRMECLLPVMFLGLDELAASYQTIQEIKGYLDYCNEMKVRGIGTMLDISGGGARFVSSNSLEGITFLLMQFTIEHEGKQKEIETVARMVRSEKMPDDNKFVHRIQFEYKDRRTKETIISYVFEEERRIRKREQGI